MANKIYCRVYQNAFKIGVNFLPWKFPEIISGAGSIRKLPSVIKKDGVSKVLVVTDAVLNQKLGLLNSLYEELDAQGIKYFVYDGVQPNPTIDNIEAARAVYIENGCEGFIAFGGGSPMDCAKATAARIVRPNKTVPQLRGQLKVNQKIPPFYAVPTTAGTGSETTIAAVVSNPKTHEKNAINDTHLLPAYAVLDPELTTGLPKHITSTTGMDALTHAVEAYIGHSNTKETEEQAKQATLLIFKYLKKAYDDGSDIEAREKMLLASHYAGKAFTRAYVGYVHSIAHNLGGTYGTPHGLANAVILPYVLDYYGETAYKRLADLADVVGIKADGTTEGKAKAFIAEIRAMNEYMNIPKGFDFIQEKDLPTIVERALKEGNPLYPVPRIMNKTDCEAVIRSFMI